MLKILSLSPNKVLRHLCQNNIPYRYIVKLETNASRYFHKCPVPREEIFKTISAMIQYSIMNSVFCQGARWGNYQFWFSAVISRRRNTSGKQKNYHTIGYNLIRRRNMRKITSMEECSTDHFNERNTLSYPKSKTPEIHLCNSRWQLQEINVSLSTDVGDAKAATITGIPVRERGGTSDAFSFQDPTGPISLQFQGNNLCHNSPRTKHLPSCPRVTQMEGKKSALNFKGKCECFTRV